MTHQVELPAQVSSMPSNRRALREDQSHEGNSQRMAWQREMERAQVQNWFKPHLTQLRTDTSKSPPAVPGDNHARPPAPPAVGPAPLQPAASTAHATLAIAAYDLGTVHVLDTQRARQTSTPLPALEPTESPSNATPRAPETACLHPLVQAASSSPSKVDTLSPAHTDSLARLLTLPGLRQPVRLHIERHGDAVHLWFGLDQTHVDRLTQISEAVHTWLREQGLRPLSMVCNGQIVWQESSRSQTPRQPEPSATGHFFIVAKGEA